MKGYESYKPSGVEWLGDVPTHWDVKRTRFVANTNPSPSKDMSEISTVSFLPMEAIGEDGSLQLDQVKTFDEVSSGYTFFEDGDVTIAKITPCFENGKGAHMQGLHNEVGFGTTELIVVRPLEMVDANYLYLLTQTHLFRKIGESTMLGSGGQKRVSDIFVKNFKFAWPPLDEQQAIACYLDTEIARIDGLIEAKRELIKLLVEYRQSVISDAVMKGLNPDPELRPSGIDWLGELPAHWDVNRLKFYIESIESGKSVNAADTPANENQIGVLKTSCVYTRAFRAEENKTVVEEELDLVSCPLKLNSLIVSRMNTPELVGAAGLVTQAPSNIYLPDRLWQVSFNHHLARPAFFWWFTQTQYYSDQVKNVCSGSSDSMQNLAQDSFKNILLFVPPTSEQQEISDYLDAETAKFDSLISHAEKEIDLLKELRASTIADAVLGRVKVI